jgi:hypothetical protein
MAKSKKTKHKVNRKRTQNLSGPIPVQFVKRLKSRILAKSKTMSDYNSLVDEKYKTNKTTTHINMGGGPLWKIYNDDSCFPIAGQIISLTWYKYSKTIYKMSQSILDYIDNTFCIPDNYDEILNNLPQKIIYIDLSDTNMMTYDGDPIYGFFINVSSAHFHEVINMPTDEFKVEAPEVRALEIVGILSAVSDQLPTINIIAIINDIVSHDYDSPSDYVANQHKNWLMKLVLKMTLYLCISKPNIENRKIDPTKNETHNSTDVTIVDLSDQYKEGPVFDPHRKEKVVREHEASDEPGYHVQPHIRAGHWHTYWTGEGRTVPVQKFVKETFVNCDDATKLPTVGRKIKEE